MVNRGVLCIMYSVQENFKCWKLCDLEMVLETEPLRGR